MFRVDGWMKKCLLESKKRNGTPCLCSHCPLFVDVTSACMCSFRRPLWAVVLLSREVAISIPNFTFHVTP